MTRSELRALRLRLIDGYTLTDEQALAVVSTLEEVADIIEDETASTDRVFAPRCGWEQCGNAPIVDGTIIALRRAGPVP